MIRKRLNNIAIGIILLMLSGFILGLVAIVGDSINSYLTIQFGESTTGWEPDTPLPSLANLTDYTLELRNTYTFNLSSDTTEYYSIADDVNNTLVFYLEGINNTDGIICRCLFKWHTFDFNNQTYTSKVVDEVDETPTAEISSWSGGYPQIFKWSNGIFGVSQYDASNSGYRNYNIYVNKVNVYAVYPPEGTSAELQLGFIVNIILAFTGIYLLLKGIKYIIGVKV